MKKKQVQHPPKFLSFISKFFPLSHVVTSCAFFIFIQGPVSILFALIWFYFIPVFIWRIVTIFWPIQIGLTYIGKKELGSSWIISHHLQWVFIAFPFFERLLMTVPGFFSLWLRSWGAKIGKKVYWTPGAAVMDRPLLEIGDHCLIGNNSYISAHAIKKKGDRYALWVGKNTIGNNSILSFSTNLGPGTKIGSDCFVPAFTKLYPGEVILDGTSTLKGK